MKLKRKKGRTTAPFALGMVLFPLTSHAQNPTVTVSVDANANPHAISPLIYGVAFASTAQLTDLNLLLNRSGGNRTSTYNWNVDATNTAADYYFESIPENAGGPGASVDNFISSAHSANAQPIITVPLLDWVAAINGTGHPYKHSFSISKYGAQQAHDPYEIDAGNGILTSTGKQITGNNPADAYTASSANFQQGWIQHLIGKWGTASGNGVRYYALDNEPSLWSSTHIDVHPAGETQDELYNKTVAYASMIKALDPNAQIMGPEEWDWPALFNSGADQATGSYGATQPDRAAHGGLPYAAWLLKSLKTHDTGIGVRLLDIFSTHYYPQNGEFGNNTDATTQGFRNRSTRSLWDPNYKEESWMKYVENGKPMLIPQMKNWVSTYYPGTKTAITEYTWGADSYIGGATAQADVLGIFGREGLDMATRWVVPNTGTAVYNAFKMYRNYDGSKSTFGETSVAATVPNPDNVAGFAAKRATDAALTVMVVSKYLSGNTPVTVNLANFPAGATAQVWQLTSTNTITHIADAPVSSGSLTASVPPLSITLFVVPRATTSVSGNVTLEGIDSSAAAQTITFVFRPTDGSASLTRTAAILPSGAFTLTNIPANSYTLHVSGVIWLAQNVTVNTTSGNVTGINVTLPAGDANGDDSVDVFDFGILVNSFGTLQSVSGSGYNAQADFNCDGSVDVVDFGLFVNNYGSVGMP